MNGCVEVVEVLLEFGAQVDLPNNVRQHCELVTVAFNYILLQNDSGSTPLAIACERGFVETARVQLEYGAYVDYQNKVFEFSLMPLHQTAH